jgi:hypothetical protein
VVSNSGRTGGGILPFLAFDAEIRSIIYTTNVIESLDARSRRAVNVRRNFPNKTITVKFREMSPAHRTDIRTVNEATIGTFNGGQHNAGIGTSSSSGVGEMTGAGFGTLPRSSLTAS